MSCIASSSRQKLASVACTASQCRGYAAAKNPHLAVSSDTRIETIRRLLYPPDAALPNSSSPTGSYHPNHLERLKHLIPNPEVYETIDRAWQLHQRQKRENLKKSLSAKHSAMQEGCDLLDQITSDGGKWSRTIYDRAMSRPTMRGSGSGETGKKATSESRWLDARIDGLLPREAWVPTETRGKGWNYDWTRPSK